MMLVRQHYSRAMRAVVLGIGVCAAPAMAQQASVHRSWSRLDLNIKSASGGQWRIIGPTGEVGRSGGYAAGDHQVTLDRVASNENLSVEIQDHGNNEPVIVAAAGQRRLSTLAKVASNAVIYQIPIRTYTAQGVGRDGVGHFDRLNHQVLAELKNFGVDYIWLTGALEQARREHVDSDVVKGEAGSYYAIRDMWDAAEELGGLSGLERLIDRIHEHGMRVLLDFVVNHTARLHVTDVLGKGHLDFGIHDIKDRFFDPQNNYFYLQNTRFNPPDQLQWSGNDGEFDIDLNMPGVQAEEPAKVTGNAVVSAEPSVDDWYETVKLNFGFDFTTGHSVFEPRPRTWDQMFDVARYWLEKGVDGFRIDFAHVVPQPFWRWFVDGLKNIQPQVFLVAEAYESKNRSPAFHYEDLFQAGMDSVYHSEMYWALHKHGMDLADIKRANPLRMPALRRESVQAGRVFTYYMENHDEIRLASPLATPHLTTRSQRAELGRAFSAYAALLPGNFLIHGGQEFQEDARIAGPFAGENGRTSIFDFVFQEQTWSWWHGPRPTWQREFYETYRRLLYLKKNSPFASAHEIGHLSFYDFEPLNWHKTESRWIAAYLRSDPTSRTSYVVVLNSHPTEAVETTLHWTNEQGRDSYGLLAAAGIRNDRYQRYRFVEALAQPGWTPRDPAIEGEGVPGYILYNNGGVPSGLFLGKLPPRTTMVFRVEVL